MHSFRRAVLRSVAAVSASAPASAVTAPLIRSTAAAAASRSSVSIAAAATATSHIASAARFFSQSARAANAEESFDNDVAAKIASGSRSEGAAPVPTSAAASGEETPYGLFIRNIVFDATEDHLKEAFSHYGPVTKAAIARDARGLSRGYGFVWYENEADKEKAIQEADGMFWHGRRMAVATRNTQAKRPQQQQRKPAASRPPNDPTDCLYIGNLPYETTDADLTEVFRGLSGVKAVRVAVDRSTGWPRGFAHADFLSVEDCIKAKEALTGRKLGTRDLRLDFATTTTTRFGADKVKAADATEDAAAKDAAAQE